MKDWQKRTQVLDVYVGSTHISCTNHYHLYYEQTPEHQPVLLVAYAGNTVYVSKAEVQVLLMHNAGHFMHLTEKQFETF